MPITLFDGILIGLMLVSGVLAMIRGFSRELLSVASWAAAAFAAYKFYPSVSPMVAPYTAQISSNKTIADLAAAGIIFAVVLLVVSLITMRIADFIVDSRIGALDRSLGFVFGALRGALLVAVALLFYNWLVPDNQPGWVANAKSKPVLESIGGNIVQMLEDPDGRSLIERFKPKGDETTPPDGDAPEDTAPAPKG